MMFCNKISISVDLFDHLDYNFKNLKVSYGGKLRNNRYKMSYNDLQIAIQACEERKLDLLMTVCPQLVVPNSMCQIFDRNGIKMEKPSLLHIAAFSGAYDIVKYLIQYDANVQALDAEFYLLLFIYL